MKKSFHPPNGPLLHDIHPCGRQGLPKRTIVEFAFLVFVLAPLLHYGSSPLLGTFSVVFAFILLEALPFLLIGSLVSGFLDEQDSWVRVEGVLGLKKVGDLSFPLIQADRITKIDPPRNPYLFPGLF